LAGLTDRSGLIRAGIVGTGFAAEAHADALRRLPNVELVGVASRTPARADAAAKQFGATRSFGDPATLIDDPDIDSVHICTINRLHDELSERALRAGKHVMTEKPLATDSQGSERLANLAAQARDAGVLTAVCFNYRHYELIQRLREMLGTGDYGDVHFVHGSYLQDWLLYDTDWNWRLDPDDNGASRAVADIGSHWIDLVQFLTGHRVSEVFADLATHHAVRLRPLVATRTFEGGGASSNERVSVENEDYGTVLIRFDTGARGAFAVSQVSPGRKNRLAFEIDTSEAAFAWDQEQPNVAWVGRRQATSLELSREPAGIRNGGQLPAGHPEGWRDALRNLFEDFYAGVLGHDGTIGARSFATFADGHRTTVLVDAIIESHRSGAWVGVRDRLGAPA
jgi:predicted dehydrogenase